MAKEEKEPVATKEPEKAAEGGTATKPRQKRKPQPKGKDPQPLPPWKVLLHNDDKNTMDHVVGSILELTPLKEKDAVLRTIEAHKTGVSLLLVTHKERAELYQDQFQSKSLTTTIEPAE
ncbi:MAG: ATP-dependent Clp protease adaptor ClpS [Phycisphaerae bacterium]